MVIKVDNDGYYNKEVARPTNPVERWNESEKEREWRKYSQPSINFTKRQEPQNIQANEPWQSFENKDGMPINSTMNPGNK